MVGTSLIRCVRSHTPKGDWTVLPFEASFVLINIFLDLRDEHTHSHTSHRIFG